MLPLLRLRTMGPDGLAMLIASGLGMLATGGISYFFCIASVICTAASAKTSVPEHARSRPVVVPGVCLRRDGTPGPDFRSRLSRAAALDPSEVHILGGATRAGVPATEAAAGRDWLTRRGIAAASIRCETASRNTMENLRAVRDALPGREPVLISNRYHLARLRSLAAGLGLSPHLCAAEDRFLPTPSVLAKAALEAAYIHWYHTGRILARLLRHQGMLSRIS